ncbi:MAG: GNAT family N-acetyltransferase [Gemmatimonadales bacterium]
MATRLPLDDGFYLSGVEVSDEDAFVTHLGDGEIGNWIPVLPRPYGREEARSWVRHRVAHRATTGVETTFAIRSPDGFLVGSVGVDDYPVGVQDWAELGYWLAPAERGRGLATSAVGSLVPHAFEHLHLARITASTLSNNRPSIRVLEKSGFRLLGEKPRQTRTGTGMRDTLFFELRREGLR